MDPIKIIFLTQEDPFYIRTFFDYFFNNYSDLNEIRAVVISKTMGDTLGKLIKRTFSFYGPIDFLRMICRYGVAKVQKILSELFNLKKGYSVSQLCKKHGISVILQDNLHEKNFLGRLQQISPDLILSVACPKILKNELLTIPRYGCINIHHAPLPKYKGMMPNFWQMYHGEQSVGITIHRMNEAIDEGSLIYQKMIPIEANESLDSLIKRTKMIGAACMIEVINKIREHNITDMENKKEDGSYFSFPTPEDVRKFREKGFRIL
jgi:methionyl-tRNA formyltransferase